MNEPTLRPVMPEMWPFLSPAAQEVWPKLAAMLHERKILTFADGLALGELCETIVEVAALRKRLRELGGVSYEAQTEGGATMYRAYPEAALLAEAQRRLVMIFSKFGITPADRPKVAAAVGEDAASPWDKFLPQPSKGSPTDSGA